MTTTLEVPHYVYIFTRQDISPEQQLVQSAHATFKMGMWLMAKNNGCIGRIEIKPDETYFTVVGVRDLPALWAVSSILNKFGRDHVTFKEPDIGDELTSIATYPISADQRSELLAFNLLKFS